MANNVLLIVRTALRRYAVSRDDLTDVRLVAEPSDLRAGGLFERACIGVELGSLLDPSDQSTQARRRALIVPLRRRYVALLVDYVDTFIERATHVPLPGLLRQRLGQPWAVGALALDDELIVMLDLRAVARSAMLQHAGENS
ncbi:MAG TPA: chemotaxis protein CheW [Roseiflexaceae bacterium]|nr:chemotaxis protein CheW [Roseiflexaceae bacterium]